MRNHNTEAQEPQGQSLGQQRPSVEPQFCRISRAARAKNRRSMRYPPGETVERFQARFLATDKEEKVQIWRFSEDVLRGPKRRR